jgi:hypothetical protein
LVLLLAVEKNEKGRRPKHDGCWGDQLQVMIALVVVSGHSHISKVYINAASGSFCFEY